MKKKLKTIEPHKKIHIKKLEKIKNKKRLKRQKKY